MVKLNSLWISNFDDVIANFTCSLAYIIPSKLALDIARMLMHSCTCATTDLYCAIEFVKFISVIEASKSVVFFTEIE